MIPRLLRGIFMHDAAMLTLLCRTMNEVLQAFYRTGLARDDARVGVICCVQRFGDRLNPHLHLHVVATDGAFAGGSFLRLALGPEDLALLQRLFAERLLAALVACDRLSVERRDAMRTWVHSGFSVDSSVRIGRADPDALLRLLRYVSRGPLAADRVAYDAAAGRVTVRSSKGTGTTRTVAATYDPLEFLALLTLQVPPPGSHTTRYYGHYASRTRGARAGEGSPATSVRPADESSPSARVRRKRWAQLLRLVFEVDPLVCPRCGGAMSFVALITPEQSAVILAILGHPLGCGPCSPTRRRGSGSPGTTWCRSSRRTTCRSPLPMRDPNSPSDRGASPSPACREVRGRAPPRRP